MACGPLVRATEVVGVMTEISVNWRRSSRCEAHNCVEVAGLSGRGLGRSTRAPDRIVRITPTGWRVFCRAVRAGRLTGRTG